MKAPDNNKNALKGCGACAGILILFIIAVSSIGGGPESPAVDQTQTEVMAVVFDLETLYGKNIDEIREVLGEPTDTDREPSALQIEMGTKEWYNSFTKNGYELTVTYDVTSRAVVDFFLSANDPSGPDGLTRNTTLLEMILNVQDSVNFTVEPVNALKDPSYYTGIIATPIR